MHGILIVLAIVLYWALVKRIIREMTDIPETTRNKKIVKGLCIFIAIAIPFLDVPIIYWEFNQLCENEAGNIVYEKVILGPEYWKKDGTLRFLPTRILRKVIPEDFEIVHGKGETLPVTRIWKTHFQIKRKSDQKILGERIGFRKGGGWLLKFFGLRSWLGIKNNSNVCPDPKKLPYSSIAKAVFKQSSN